MIKTLENKTEQQWAEKFRKGDEQALSYFFNLYHQSLLYFAGRLVQDASEAKDIVSDVFLKLWQRKEEFATAQNIKAFLYISCRNACLNHLEHLKVKSKAQAVFLRELEKGEDTILFEIVRSEVMEMLVKEINALPEKCQEVFQLIYFDLKKTDEIARDLGLSVKTVRNYKAMAVDLLRSAMLKKGISGSVYLAFLMLIYGK